MEVKLYSEDKQNGRTGITVWADGINSSFLLACINTLIFVVQRNEGLTREQVLEAVEVSQTESDGFVDDLSGKLS